MSRFDEPPLHDASPSGFAPADRLGSDWGARSFWIALLATALVTSGLALLFGTVEHARQYVFDEDVYRRLTRNLLDHGFFGYGDRRLVAYRAPGYPYFNAGVRLINDGYVAIRIAQAILAGGTIVVTGQLAIRLFGRRVAAVAMLLLTLVGTMAAYASVELTETLATFTFTSSLLLVVLAVQRENRGLAALGGLLVGLSSLTRPQSLMFILVATGFIAWAIRSRKGVAVACIFASAAVLVLMPWTVRNYQRLGTFVPVSTEAGVNLFLANNPNATGRFQEIDMAAPEEYARISRLSEVQQDREWLHLGLRFIRDRPLIAVRNWLHHGVVFLGAQDPWVHRQSRLRDAIRVPFLDDRFLVPFALLGIAVTRRTYKARTRRLALLPAAAIGYTVFVFMVTIPHARFRHSIIPLMAVYAAMGLVVIEQGLRRRYNTRKRLHRDS